MLRYLLAAGVGVALAYFLDPNQGLRRREAAAKQLSGIVRGNADQLDDVAHHTASTAQALSDRTARLELRQAVTQDGPTAESFPYAAHIHDSQSYQ